MAETPVAPNNKAISFGAKPAREPAGLKNAATRKPGSKKIRKSVKQAMKRGMISEKAANKHLGDL